MKKLIYALLCCSTLTVIPDHASARDFVEWQKDDPAFASAVEVAKTLIYKRNVESMKPDPRNLRTSQPFIGPNRLGYTYGIVNRGAGAALGQPWAVDRCSKSTT